MGALEFTLRRNGQMGPGQALWHHQGYDLFGIFRSGYCPHVMAKPIWKLQATISYRPSYQPIYIQVWLGYQPVSQAFVNLSQVKHLYQDITNSYKTNFYRRLLISSTLGQIQAISTALRPTASRSISGKPKMVSK